MKHLLLTTIAAVLVMGCGESQQSAPAPEAQPVEPVAEAATPEPPTPKVPDISIYIAAREGNIEAVKQHLAAGTDVNEEVLGEVTPFAYGGSIWSQGNRRTTHRRMVRMLNAKNDMLDKHR